MAVRLLDTVEKLLGCLFKDLPKPPTSLKDILARLLPFFAVFAALIYLWNSLAIVIVARRVIEHQDWLYAHAADAGPGNSDRFFFYAASLLSLFLAFLLAWAVPKLFAKAREGWRLVFAATILSLGASLLSAFLYGYGFGDFLLGLVFGGLGLYVLLQLKTYYQVRDGLRPRRRPVHREKQPSQE